ELLDPAECKRRHPLITTENLLGALWDPLDGDIDPAQLCQALARRARKAGAEVHRNTPVTGLGQNADGEWVVETSAGTITCEHVVNAGGYRCNEIAAMMGVVLPVASMEHQYFLTEPIPEIEALDFRVPLIRCPTDDFYSRQEKTGLLVGFYEQGCKTWGVDGIDPNFTNALCPDDPDRVLDVLEGVFRRLPCLTETGIHTIVNGPITYTPDGVPLVGRIPGKRNAWCITGLRAGVGEGGGHGWLLAQEMVHGEACYDTWALDPRRFSDYADVSYTAKKAVEDYQNEFRFHLPHEHRPAGRPARLTPLYETLKDQGAEFGVVNGWERALFFKPDPDFVDEPSFRFTPTHQAVAAEVRTVKERAGLMEVSGFNRYRIEGPGAAEWLAGLFCGRTPARTGKVGLGYFLTDKGNVLGEATLAKLGDDHFWWGSAAAAEHHDWDWLMRTKPASVNLTKLTNTHTILVVAGPRSRAILSLACPDTDWSSEGFPWLSTRPCRIAGADITAMSVSFSGELAWEMHVANEDLARVHAEIEQAGAGLGMGHFGLYATESMRIEKGYRHWKADLISEFDPLESNLGRFLRMDHDFPGRAALDAKAGQALRRTFVTLEIDNATGPAHPGGSLYNGGHVVGTVTSAAYGHRVAKNLAMGFIDPAYGAIGTGLGIDVVDQRATARVTDDCLYDPQNKRMRA
ncbi:MAG: FAD-dependent oxidoreductase, partial [Paracoccaceae bacterium]|nr:FAD-dependent oxidoreductase [Paracoccaceae bacterium]